MDKIGESFLKTGKKEKGKKKGGGDHALRAIK